MSSGKGNIFEKGKACEAMSAKVVSGLTDILKNVLSKPKFEKSGIADRFREFVDEISNSSSLWGFAKRVKMVKC